MTERNTAPENQSERLLAHERLSTGLLARWARACASHPWRVVFASLASIAVLLVLVFTIGGSLKDKFEIPGSDTQKATDLIKAEFSSEQGSVLNLVFAAPKGERLDTPERKAAVNAAVAKLKTAEFKPKDGKVGIDSVGNPFSDQTFSDSGRIAYAEAQFSDVIKTADRSRVVAVENAVRDTVEPAGVTAEFNGEAESPPIQQGIQELLGFLAAFIVLMIVFRTFVATFDSDRARARGRRNGVHPPVHPRRADRHQHDHADPRVDDRHRRRDRLLALHRHAVQTIPARGPVAGRRGDRGRRLRRSGRALRGPHRRHLGDRARVLRPRLHHQARHRRSPGRADDGPDRQLAPDRGARKTRAQDRSVEGAVPQADRRLRGRSREVVARALGPVRDPSRQADLRDPARGRCSSWPGRRRSCDWALPTRGPSRPTRPHVERTTSSPRASGRASTARSRSSST